MFKDLSSTQKTWLIIAAMLFVFLAWLTTYVNSLPSEPEKPEKPEQPEQRDYGKYFERVEKVRKDSTLGNEKKSPDAPLVVHQTLEEGDPIAELDGLIGLTTVKEEVHSLANFVKMQQQRRDQGLKVPNVTYHCVFTGNPGTGKTTVARILARIYKDLGVLKKGHLVETDASGLIAGYVGQTAEKTNAVIDSALGGVLFIDEAYALSESRGGYGKEAIATLVKRMEDNRDNLVVVVAGYTKEMKDFIDTNPGLKSRFTRYLEFPDYSAEELRGIFMLRANKYSYKLEPEADALLLSRLEEIVANKKNRDFGNGRYARNLFEMAITCQANRLSTLSAPTVEDLSTLTVEDISKAFDNVKS